jgi:elongation factor 1-gamma
LIAAKYSGVSLKIAKFVPGQTDAQPAFLAKFPPSSVPVFEGDDGTCLFDANAIAFYCGNEKLRGGSSEHLVTQWVNFADNVILPPVATWVYPCLGVIQYNKQNTEKAKATLKTVLSYINNHLRHVTYLVGERITQADITVFTALHPLFTHVLDKTNRDSYPHLVRWYLTIANQREVRDVIGDVHLCSEEAHFDAKKFAELHRQEGKTKEVKGKEEKQKTTKPKEEKKAPKKEKKEKAKEVKEEEPDEEVAQKASTNPMADLPAGNFDMDAFKRIYSNEDIATVAIPYFWDNFDPQNYSIWFCEYKYPDELGMIFMSCNLINGMFQRLERMLKYAFSSMCVFGDNKKSSISGVWFWRGPGLAFELSPDFQVDYDSYEWRKLDPNAEETKQLVHDYFLQQFKDKPYNQCRIFK